MVRFGDSLLAAFLVTVAAVGSGYLVATGTGCGTQTPAVVADEKKLGACVLGELERGATDISAIAKTCDGAAEDAVLALATAMTRAQTRPRFAIAKTLDAAVE